MDNEVLVLGVGNEFVADDGAGVAACRLARSSLRGGQVSFREHTTGGIDLLKLLVGYRRAIVLDAIDDPSLSPGDVVCGRLEPQRALPARWSLHTMNLNDVLSFGRALEYPMPGEVWLVGIQVEDAGTFGAPLGQKVQTGVQNAAAMLGDLLAEMLHSAVPTITEVKEHKRHDCKRAYVS